MSWTDERIEQLRNMWEKGLTASQIADELGGVSRNAVIGKAHRLGLKSRPSPVKATDKMAKPVKAAAPKPAAPVAAPRPAAPVAPRPVAAAPRPEPKAPVQASDQAGRDEIGERYADHGAPRTAERDGENDEEKERGDRRSPDCLELDLEKPPHLLDI